MKKLLIVLLFVLSGLLVSAQTNKPTKQQTIDYLKQILVNQGMVKEERVTEKYNNIIIEQYSVVKVDFVECNFTIVYDYSISYSKTPELNSKSRTSQSVDLSKIETVFQYDGPVIGLGTINKQKLIRITDYDKEKNSTEENLSAVAEIPASDFEQIMKAFNYLRKLCGAPDPIKFD